MTNEDAGIEERLAPWVNSIHIQGVFHPGIFPQEHDRCFALVADLQAPRSARRHIHSRIEVVT
jgi:hypothetical protein